MRKNVQIGTGASQGCAALVWNYAQLINMLTRTIEHTKKQKGCSDLYACTAHAIMPQRKEAAQHV
jgi:hypothetical protein